MRLLRRHVHGLLRRASRPADDPRFTIYVVVQNPSNGGGGGSVAGPAFAKIMSYALRRYGVPPTGTQPSRLPVEW